MLDREMFRARHGPSTSPKTFFDFARCLFDRPPTNSNTVSFRYPPRVTRFFETPLGTKRVFGVGILKLLIFPPLYFRLLSYKHAHIRAAAVTAHLGQQGDLTRASSIFRSIRTGHLLRLLDQRLTITSRTRYCLSSPEMPLSASETVLIAGGGGMST